MRILTACSLGLFFFSYLHFLLGVCGLLHPAITGSVLVAMVFIGFQPLRECLRALFGEPPSMRLTRLEVLLLGLLVCSAIFKFWFGYAPPTADDELVYHISLPALYVKMGRMGSVPTMFESFFYLNGELFHTAILLLRDFFAVKAMVWVMGILYVLALYNFSRRYARLDRTSTLLAVALVYTSPVMTSLHGTTSVDHFSLFLEMVVLSLYWEWTQSQRKSYLVIIGILTGASVGFRNYSVNWIGALLLVMMVFDRKPKAALMVGLVTAIVALPWPLRNYAITGNPFYPSALWAGAASDPLHMTMRPEVTWRSFLTTLVRLPYFVSGGMLIWSFGLLPMVLAPLAWLSRNSQGMKKIIILVLVTLVITHFIPWAWMSPRYYSAALPLLAILASQGLFLWFEGASRRLKTAAALWIAFLLLVPNFALSAYYGLKRIPYFFGFQSEEQYLMQQYLGSEGYPMMQYLRTHHRPPSRFLVLGMAPTLPLFYYAECDFVPLTAFSPAHFRKSTKELALSLQAAHITHVLLVQSEFEVRSDGHWHYTSYPKLSFWVPPLSAPYFEVEHRTTQSTLYRVHGRA